MRKIYQSYRRGQVNQEMLAQSAKRTQELTKELLDELEAVEKYAPKPVRVLLKVNGKLLKPARSIFQMSKRIIRLSEMNKAADRVIQGFEDDAKAMNQYLKPMYEQAVKHYRDNYATVQKLAR